MIELTEGAGLSWWAIVRGKLAVCWWRLLAVQALSGLIGFAVLTLCLGLGCPPVARDLVLLAEGGLGAAWSWSASLRILEGGHGFLSALRPDLRRMTRLWGWLVALNLLDLLRLLGDVDGGAYFDLIRSPVAKVILLAFLYLAFAAALLPMAVLLEGRGFRRAWRLSHGGWRTVLRVLPVVVLGLVASEALKYSQLVAGLGMFPPPSYLPLVQAAAFLAGALKGTVTVVLLYAAYRLAEPGPVGADPERTRPAGRSSVQCG